MKKISIALLSIAALSTANASLYVGVKAGASKYNNNVNSAVKAYNDAITDAADKTTYSAKNTNGGTAYGIVFGKKLTSNVAVELAIEDINGVKYEAEIKEKGDVKKHKQTITHSSLAVGVQGKYLINVENLDLYVGAGLAHISTDYKKVEAKSTDDAYTAPADVKASASNFTLTLSAGVVYNFTDSVALNLEYKYFNKVGKADQAAKVSLPLAGTDKYNPSVNLFTAGLTYSFGAAPAAAKKVSSENFILDSQLLFAYNSFKLSPNANPEIEKIANSAKSYNNSSVAVVGHTDRLGQSAYNLDLSEKRAISVATALISKGVASNSITIAGVGSAQPVTNGCYNVKGAKALIDCLAKDRRVEVQVSGIKK